MPKKKKIGLALSGGGARGFAHLGVVKALYEKDIKPGIFSGTSAGALIAAFLANEKSPDEIFEFFKGHKIFDISEIRLPDHGLLNMKRMRKEIKNELGIDDLKDIKQPFYLCVANMTKGKVEYFNKGPAVDLLLASASIPVLFSPVKINDDLYSDGGVFDNLPVKPIRGKCEKLIGVHVNPIHKVKGINSMIEMASRTFSLTVHKNIENLKDTCDLWIEPDDLDKFGILDFNKADEIFQIGYEFAKKKNISL
jgi:NTE family protein